MAQIGFTPIQLYRTSTAAAVPTAGNLAAGELALNTTDEKLYFKNAAGAVKLLASNAGAVGDVVGPASSTDNALVAFNGTTGKLIKGAATVTLAQGGTGAITAPAALANLMGFTTTATAAGTTTLTNTSSSYQIFTGSTTQTVVLPVVSTLATGWTFHIVNNSTGNLTVNSSGGNLVITVLPGTTTMCTCILITGTTAASWEAGLTDFSTATGTGAVVLSNSPTFVTPALGTPSSATLTNATGLPISTGVSGLGTGVATFLATPSSANLRAAVTDETGTGSLVFATSPTLVTPALGTPSSGTLTNATGLPISTGVSGLGTGVATALAVNVGTAGAPVVNGGALGTPSSGTLTNATGLPLTTGVTGTLPVANGGTGITSLGTGVATFLGTPSSANLRAALTDETGTGVAVFGTSPVITTSLTTASTTFALVNTGATTLNFGGAATTLNVGAATGTMTVNNTTLAAKAITASNTLSVTNGATIQTMTVGLGGSALADNTAIGVSALENNTTGVSNTAYGYQALLSNTGGSFNTAIGYQTLNTNTSGDYNTAIGYIALQNNIGGVSNTAVGFESLTANSSGNNNTACGMQTLTASTTGSANTAVGTSALYRNTTGSDNTAIGISTLAYNTTGGSNTATGYAALFSNTTGIGNVANGYQALYNNTTGSNSIAIGKEALYSNTIDGNSIAIGYQALYNNTGFTNSAVGFWALLGNTTGNFNVAFGYRALASNTTGSNNAAFGDNAGSDITTGSYNVIVGSYAGGSAPISAAGSNWVVLSDGQGNVGEAIDSAGNAQFLRGAVVVYAPEPASISTTATLTNANIRSQIINTTGTSYTVTMPLGTTLETLVSWSAVNLGYDFSVINTASGTITMAGNTGITTIVGSATIATGVSARFRIRRLSANVYTMYRI